MNTTLIQFGTRRSPFKAGNSIGADNINRATTHKDKADAVFVRVCLKIGSSINEGSRELWARGMATVDRTAANAYRTAQGMARNFSSIFSPSLTPAEREAAFQAGVEAVREAKATEHLPGAKVAADAIGEFEEGGAFIPKGAK